MWKMPETGIFSSLALHTHKKVYLGFTSRKAARVLDGKPSSGRGDRSRWGSSKATPKKDGKVATANSQGLSTPSASQPLPCHSRWGTSHHHKSHKQDASKRWKKADNVNLAQKGAGHKAHKDGGCCQTGTLLTSTGPQSFAIKTLLHSSCVL